MSRLMGHSYLNSTLHILKKHQDGLCEHCREEQSVKHVVPECRKYKEDRAESVKEMNEKGLKEISVKSVLDLRSKGRERWVLWNI